MILSFYIPLIMMLPPGADYYSFNTNGQWCGFANNTDPDHSDGRPWLKPTKTVPINVVFFAADHFVRVPRDKVPFCMYKFDGVKWIAAK